MLSDDFVADRLRPNCLAKLSSLLTRRTLNLLDFNWPLSWMPSQLFGIKSLVLYGLAASAGPGEILCMALEMLLIAYSLPLIAVHISSRTRCKVSAISCLICCCNVTKSAVVAIHACCYANAAAAADLEPPPAMLNRAALP